MTNKNLPTNCHVMAKPSGFVCNLDCKYCFYLEKEKLYPERNQNWKMEEATLEQFIKQQIDAQQGSDVDIAWQGGEPTLMGIEFYQKAIEFSDKHRGTKTVHHAFQTNGILLDDKWCEFFKQHNFLIGISIDGPAELHDAYRVTRSGKATHAKVMQGIHLLKKHDIPFNTLTVINDINARQPLAVYQFLKQIGSKYMQFIPLVEQQANNTDADQLTLIHPDSPLESNVTSWSVPAWQYGEFLNQIFDQWVRKDVGTIFIQTFDSTLANWCKQPGGVCIFAPTCGNALALEANGDLYSCDHYVYPEYKLGNIHEISIKEMNQSEQAIDFGQAKKTRLTPDCQSCEYRFACHGGCPKHRFITSKSGAPHHNYLCEGYLHFFQHTASYMAAMRDLVSAGRPATEVMWMIHQHELSNQAKANGQSKVGRNDPCPCGSNKKFKQCCGK
jgi:uncharacterized protein